MTDLDKMDPEDLLRHYELIVCGAAHFNLERRRSEYRAEILRRLNATEKAIAEMQARLTTLSKVIRSGQVRYSRNHDDSPPFPYEVAYSMKQWDELQANLGRELGEK